MVRMEEFRTSYIVLMGRLERKKFLRRPRHSYDDNITTDFKEVRCDAGDLIGLAQDRTKGEFM